MYFLKFKKALSVLLTATLLASFATDVIEPTAAYAEEDTSDPQIQFLVSQFSTTEAVIQDYRDKGYSLGQIGSAFYKARQDKTSFDVALASLYPKEVNKSAEATTKVINKLVNPLFEKFNAVESSQSSIVKTKDFFPADHDLGTPDQNKPTEEEKGCTPSDDQVSPENKETDTEKESTLDSKKGEPSDCAQDEVNSDKPATDKSETDKPTTEKPATEKPTTDNNPNTKPDEGNPQDSATDSKNSAATEETDKTTIETDQKADIQNLTSEGDKKDKTGNTEASTDEEEGTTEKAKDEGKQGASTESKESAKEKKKSNKSLLRDAQEVKPVLEKAPKYDKNSFNTAPFSIGSNNESVSSLSGGLGLQQTDATLPGRNGLSFSLSRQYNSDDSKFYEVGHGVNKYSYNMYKYFVQFNGIRKQKIPQYTVKYIESRTPQIDFNNDGVPDTDYGVLDTQTLTKGVYATAAEANQVASRRVTYTIPAEFIEIKDSRTSSSNSFPSSIFYTSNGLGGTLYQDGAAVVTSGSYQATQSRTESTSCTNAQQGKYDKNGVWSPTESDHPCPTSISYNSGGFSGTLNRVDTNQTKACPSPSKASATYTCTVTYVASYKGDVTKPGYDTRQYKQNYKGTITKPSYTTDTKYTEWESLGGGAKQRYAYTLKELPFVETSIIEGPGTSISLSSVPIDSWSEANDFKNLIMNNPGELYDDDEGEYNDYISSSPNATVQSFVYDVGEGETYYNSTSKPLNEKLYPIGKGWSWKLPYVDTQDGKQRVYLAEGGSYEVEGTKLKGSDWEGLTFNKDTTVTVNGEVSQYVLTNVDGTSNQYFAQDGRILQISDAYKNTVQFMYEQNAVYGRKLLSQVKDAIGNTIQISYSATQVTLSKGNKVVQYNKHTEQGIELLDSVTDEIGRKTTYSYKLVDAKFNLMNDYPERAISNPYVLMSQVQYPTGAATIYTYEATPVKRYLGTSSVEDHYRMSSRKDQISYADGTKSDNNRQTFFYNGDLGSSYDQDMTFSTVMDNGLTNTKSTYKKRYSSESSQYYLDQMVIKADGLEKTTAYTYGKTVANHPLASATPTGTVTTNNLNGDSLSTLTQYDDYGNVTSSTNEKGAAVTNTYDSNKHWLVSSTEQVDMNNSKYTELSRNSFGDITQIVVRKGSNTGPLLQQVNYSGFDSFGNMTLQTLLNGSKQITTTTEYSSVYQSAFPTKQSVNVTDADGKVSTVSSSLEYDSLRGNVTASVDGENHRTEYQYDALGRATKVIYPDHTSLSSTYDDIQNTGTVTNELGIQSMTRWNPLGSQIEKGIIGNKGYEVKEKSGYDPYGRVDWSEDALGNRTKYRYDSWGRNTSTVSADGTEARTTYNDSARTQTQIDAEGNVQTSSSDIYGRTEKIEEKTAAATSLKVMSKSTYDKINGSLLTQTDANMNTTNYNYDLLGQLMSVTDANGDTTKYNYDMFGQLISKTDPNGSVKESTYDELGRAIITKDKVGQLTKQYYNANNSLIKSVDRNGITKNLTYDLKERLIQRISPDETVSFAYDDTGKRVSMTDKTGTTLYQYDPSTEELKQKTYSDGQILKLDYDAAGNRTALSGPFGLNVTYTYDNMNRLKTIGSSKDDIPLAEYAYKANGLLQQTSVKSNITTKNNYEGLKLLSVERKKGDQLLTNFEYGYDANSNIISDLAPNGTLNSYKYDKLNRISASSAFDEEYAYDKVGNRSSLTTNQVHNAEEKTNTFDTQNQLIQVKVNGKSVQYQYDGDGLLVNRTEDGTKSRYYYDGDQIIAEASIINDKPQLKARYIRGQKLEAIEYPDGKKVYPFTNGHGDITEIRDENGAELNHYEYDIWGNILKQEETVYNPFRYSGELWDNTVQLEYLRARWYNPSEGRFISEDTYEGQINNPMSLNLYTYVTNNPLIYIDPSGMCGIKSWKDAGDCFVKAAKVITVTAKTIWYIANEAALAYPPAAGGEFVIVKGAGFAWNGFKWVKTAITGGTKVESTYRLKLDLQLFGRMNSQAAEAAAKKLGYTKTNFYSNGAPVFRKGNKYITPDVDSHIGGVWKMADSVKNLGSKSTRKGTYNKDLKRIGD
ncbi:RHS repeat-associated protein [Paenibacillus shirakamiensis]|uniref:RHS repeat-associated protein n=1 Tax=Paenibacillus shirakamiensis TaxID=1265935 RepID=A0ABS4JBK6_9BACL|nr:toxin C-terminal domain-containing protein [Paenibacillus shirakamiensis]MBP1999097.1 RHS repeat-associated protein [Paenibacillus shirakamiensis]